MNLAALSAFNSVAALGGFSRASRLSGQPKTTLSRQVRALEDELGVRLIERGSHALRLTEEGLALHALTERPLAEVQEAGLALAGGLARPRGRLRISAPMLFSHVAMGRVAAGFVAAHPDVRLELSVEDRLVDPVEDGVDVVIRINPAPDVSLVGRRFFRDEVLLAAPPSMPRPGSPDPGRPEAAPGFPAVLLRNALEPPVWTCLVDGESRRFHPRPVLVLSSLLVIRDAVREGAGAALLPRSLIADDLAAGRLVSWGVQADREVEGWVLHASRRLASPKVTAFVAFLCDVFEDQVLR